MAERKACKVERLWETIRRELEAHGVDFEELCGGDFDPSQVKVIGLAANLGESLRELGNATRDQVVMVRVDERTSADLDAWVETEVVKSRSEAAALFIREGLKVRAAELEELRDALRAVERAKSRLREKARGVFDGGEA